MTTATVGKKNPKYKWEVLALLWVAYLLNQADRQVFNVVLPLIREDLGLSDVAIGSIATVFNLFYAVLVPIGGLVGDRFSRKWIVTGSILFWSVATMFTGLCNGFVMLVLMRSVATGGGEAFFGPANYSLLAQYHDKTRPSPCRSTRPPTTSASSSAATLRAMSGSCGAGAAPSTSSAPSASCTASSWPCG